MSRITLNVGSHYGGVFVLWEPIGNVLYSTNFGIGQDAEQWGRASDLYNKLADSLADAQGVEREPVDLNGGTPLIPRPSEYVPLTGPSST